MNGITKINKLCVAAVLVTALTSYAALAQTYAYTANLNSANVSAYSVDASSGALTAVPGSPFGSGSTPPGNLGGIVTDPQCKHVFAGNFAGTVSAYSINLTTGSLAAVPGSPFAAGSQSAWVAIDPSGTHLYVANYGDSTVSVYSVAANGALSQVAGSPFAAGGVNPDFALVDRSGKFLYLANQSSDNVSAFAISSTGALTPVAGSPFPVGSSPRGLTIDRTNSHLYVSNTVSGSMSVFNIDASTGALTEITGSPFPIAFNIYQMAIHPLGQFAWIGNDSGGIYGVTIDPATGALSPTPGSPFPTRTSATPAVTIDPSGQWLYTNDQLGDTLTEYQLDVSTGTATPLLSFPTGQSPTYTAICSGSKTATTTTLTSSLNPSFVGQLVTFTAMVSPSMPRAPTGTVTFKLGNTVLGTGSLSSGQATFTTSTLPAGSLKITAVYGGDSLFAGSTSTVLTQTVNKASTTTSLGSSPNPSSVGQLVTFVATVRSATGATPDGTVAFKTGSTTLGTGTVDPSGTATFSTSTLSKGKYNIKAVYSGSSGFAGSTSNTITQVVQ